MSFPGISQKRKVDTLEFITACRLIPRPCNRFPGSSIPPGSSTVLPTGQPAKQR